MRFKTATLFILIALLTTLSATDTHAQKRRRGKTSTSTPQPKTEETQITPAKEPQKSAVQLLIEKDAVILSQLTTENKQDIDAAIRALDHAMQLYAIRGYNDFFLHKLLKEGTETTFNKGLQALPKSTLKSLLKIAYNSLIDAWLADTYYVKGFGDNELLNIVERYGLRGTAGALIGREIFKKSSASFELAIKFAEGTGTLSERK